VLGIRLAMFGKEFDVALFQSIVIPERPEESTAGQLIGKFVAAVCRSDLFQD